MKGRAVLATCAILPTLGASPVLAHDYHFRAIKPLAGVSVGTASDTAVCLLAEGLILSRASVHWMHDRSRPCCPRKRTDSWHGRCTHWARWSTLLARSLNEI